MKELVNGPTVVIDEYSSVTRLAIGRIISFFSPRSRLYTEITSAQKVIEKVKSVSADLLITDLFCCKGEKQITSFYQLCMNHPQLKVIVYCNLARSEMISMLKGLPQVSFVSRASSLKEFEQAVATTLSGGQYRNEQIKTSVDQDIDRILENFHLLTNCEKKVITHLLSGKSLSDISSLLNRSVKTISAHKCNAMRKLDAKNITDIFVIKSYFINELSYKHWF